MTGRRMAILVLLGAAVIVIVLGLTGLTTVRPGERAVVRRFGALLRPEWGPGLHLGLPPGLDRVDRVRTDLVQRLVVGVSEQADSERDPAAGEFLTGDLNLVRVQAIIQYRVASPSEMLIAAERTESLLQHMAEAALTRALAQRTIDDVIRGERIPIAKELESRLTAAAARLELGLQILGVSLTEARPPTEVAPEFLEAQAAESRRDRRTTEGRTQSDTMLTEANAQAHRLQDTARAAAHRRVLGARAQADRFVAMLVQVRHARALTVQRVYLDAVRSLLGKVRRKVVLPPGDAVDLTVLGIDE